MTDLRMADERMKNEEVGGPPLIFCLNSDLYDVNDFYEYKSCIIIYITIIT